MVRQLVVLLAAAGCGRIGFDAATGGVTDGSTPFGSAWSEHRAFEAVNPTTEEMHDVPILVRLDATRIDYARAASDGHDLRFTDANGELAYEIERWDPQGDSILWVRVPLLAASPAHTALAIYYGNPAALGVAGEATWSSDHVGVYHFAGNARDATSTHLDATAVSSTMPVLDLLGQSLAMSDSGPASYAVIARQPALDDVITFSGWVRSASQSGIDEFEGLIVWPIEGIAENSPYLGLHEDMLFFEAYDASGTNEGRTLEAWPVNTWVHLALVESATSVATYVNGAPRVTMPVPNGSFRPQQPLFFGADCDNCALGDLVGSSDFLDGAIDEIRLERVERSASWWVVQNASMRDTLLVWP